MEFESPTQTDWEKWQGHVPFVQIDQDKDMLYILHPDRVVPTPIAYFDKMGKINLTGTNNQVFSVPVAYLERFHGKPCEQRSRAIGGKGYSSNF